MAESSTAFSGIATRPPRVVGISYGIFDIPGSIVEPFVFTVPTNYNLFIANETAPASDVGSIGDWYMRLSANSAVIYQKTSGVSWTAETTITGAASANLTSVHDDIADLSGSLTTLQSTVSEISSTFATESFVETRKSEAITSANTFTTASVATEATARVAADGFLSGKYTLKVSAGNVVTGMNITSSSGGGSDVSEVTFQADKFKIYNGSSGTAVFDLNGSNVGISGWVIGANTLVGGNLTLNSNGSVVGGTANNVAVLSASDATYRFWAGNAAAASAPFSITKTGDLVATSASISGIITASTVIVGHTSQYTDSTTSKFQVINGSGQTNLMQNFCFGSGTPNFEGWVAGGTIASPTQALSGRLMKLKLVTYGSGGGGWINGGNASVWLRTTEAHTLTARGTEIEFRTTPNGSISEQVCLLIGQDNRLYIGGGSDVNLYKSAAATLKTDASIVSSLNITGVVISASGGGSGFAGNGANITDLSATQLTIGTVPDARFPATLPASSGANLTSLNASSISSGTLDNSRLSFTATGTGDVPVNGYVSVGGVKFATVA